MTDLCYVLSKTNWTKSYWRGEPIYAHDRNILISSTSRVWISPTGKTFLESSAYSVAFNLASESEYSPIIPVTIEKSVMFHVNQTQLPF